MGGREVTKIQGTFLKKYIFPKPPANITFFKKFYLFTFLGGGSRQGFSI